MQAIPPSRPLAQPQWGLRPKKQKILVVDDDRMTVDLVKLYLERGGFAVLQAYDGREALEQARTATPDLVILDLMLPQVDGLDVCHMLREHSRVPIIMLTARTTEADKLVGLNLGADDYVTKPFSPHELVARVRAVLRRMIPESGRPPVVRFGDVVMDVVKREVRRGGALVHLTAMQFDLLATLVGEPGRAFSRLDLMERAFGWDYDGLERTIDAHIKNLRKKIEPDPRQPTYIVTVQGFGYKFVPPPEAAPPEA
jgi:DNA-binding response OmpR family regulator